MEEVCPGEREDHIEEYDGCGDLFFVRASDYVVFALALRLACPLGSVGAFIIPIWI